MHTLIDWYCSGENVDRRIPLLSTYLDHVDPASTHRYLEAVPGLLALVSERMDRLLGFAHSQTGKQPFELDLDDLDAR